MVSPTVSNAVLVRVIVTVVSSVWVRVRTLVTTEVMCTVDVGRMIVSVVVAVTVEPGMAVVPDPTVLAVVLAVPVPVPVAVEVVVVLVVVVVRASTRKQEQRFARSCAQWRKDWEVEGPSTRRERTWLTRCGWAVRVAAKVALCSRVRKRRLE